MRYFFSVLFIGSLLFSQNIDAKRMPPSMIVKRTLEQMFAMCEVNNSKALAEHVVYRGKDEKRKWKDHCNIDNEDEMRLVWHVRTQIKSDVLPFEYKFVKFMTETESEGTWYIWELEVMVKGEAQKVFFAFLKVNGRYVLGDID